ncbi:MAG: GNAT family N-acetyltransferase [Theionarchaea archaeon]|nr:GNAT family N-acetyltransferase [Theionarchaea archaeon]
MKLTMRKYQDEEDYWQIREFLREVFLLNNKWELSWPAYRFDYWRWHGVENLTHFRLQDVVFIWETINGQIAAVLNPEGKGEVYLQVHPELCTPELEEEMLVTAEKHLAISGKNKGRKLRVWAHQHDSMRQDILIRRGYTKSDWPEHQRRQSLEEAIAEAHPPPGYTVRALGDGAELLERCYASGLAFHPDDIQIAVQNREDVSWYRNIQNAPLYRRDLDIVAIAPDGAVASFCTVWFDDVTRSGAFEPVGTVPAHQRRGLGKAVMCEGLHRLKRMGATMAYVGGYTEAANALYASAGFAQYGLSEPWAKEL